MKMKTSYLAAMAASAVLLFTVSATAQEAPAAPSNVAATVTSDPYVQLAWDDNSTNETIFFIYRATSPEGPFDWWDVAYADNPSYTDVYGLLWAPVYYYKVTAVDELTGLESEPSNTAEAVLPVGVPRAPTALEGSVEHGTVVYLAWEDASWNEEEFVISCSSTGPNGTYYDIATEPANVGCHVIEYANPWSTFYYKIRARNSYGSSAAFGPLEIHTGDWEY